MAVVPRESVSPKLAFAAQISSRGASKIDFFALNRGVQERFLAATQGTAPPVPLLFAPASRRPVLAWLGASALFLLATLVVARLGSGDVASSLARQQVSMLGVYFALLAAAAYCVVHAITVARASNALLYPAGTYLFPACAVVATGRHLKVVPMTELADLQREGPDGRIFRFVFTGGTRLSFKVGTLEEGDRVERGVADAREALRLALLDETPAQLAMLDPLFDAAVSSPLGPTESITPPTLTFARLGWIVALVVGAAFSPMVWLARNFVSDEAMYGAVKRTDSIAADKQYLAQGGRHSSEVADVLLPRAELREAVAKGTVDALQDYARSHTGSKIQPEIDVALRKAMLAELDKAKSQDNVAALRAFAQKYPDNHLDKELAAAIHARYAAALAAYKPTAPDAQAAGFFERLLGYAEKHDPQAEVRVRLRASKNLTKADEVVSKSRYFAGASTLPSRFFNPEHLRSREDALTKALAARFSEAFPPDVISFAPGAPIGDSDGPLPEMKVPTLVVDHGFEWSSVQFVNLKPKTLLVGISVPMDTAFVVPDGAAPMKVKLNVWRGLEPWRFKDQPTDSAKTQAGAFEAKVYDGMVDAGFDQIQKRILDTFFQPKK
jgi:hypothetical protein